MLKSMSLQNFRCHKNLSIEFKPLTVITGVNAAGKSSIAEAILTLFTGRNSAAPEGSGLKDCIMTSQDNAIITADYKTVKIIREIPNALTIVKDGEKLKGSLTNLQDMIYDSFGVDAEGLYTALDSSGFFTKFTGSERKEFLFSILKIKNTLDAAMDMLDEYILKKKVPIEIVSDIMGYIGRLSPRPTSRDELYEKAYSDRRALKQNLESYSAQLESVQHLAETLTEDTSIEDLPDAKELLEELKIEHQQLKAEHPNLNEDKSLLNTLQVEFATAKRQLSDITAGLSSVGKKQITCPVFKIVCGTKIEDIVSPLSVQKTETSKKIQEIEKQIQELTIKIKTSENEYTQKIQAIEQRISKGEKLIAALEQSSKVNTVVKDIKKKEAADKKKLDIVDLLVDIYGPQGIVIDILKRKITEFEQTFNNNLSKLVPGYSIRVIVTEKTCDFFVSGNEQSRGIKNLSTSELLRMKICMLKTLQEFFGIRLLIIDDIEVLDTENEKLLTAFAQENAKDGQVIIITAYVPFGLKDEHIVTIGPIPKASTFRAQGNHLIASAKTDTSATINVHTRPSPNLVAEIQTKWPLLIKSVLKDRPGLSTCLSSAEISSFNGELVVLTLAEQFRAEMLTTDIESWQPTAVKIIGKPVKFKIVSTEIIEPAVVMKTEAIAEKEKKGHEREPENKPGVQMITDLFGGHIVPEQKSETQN